MFDGADRCCDFDDGYLDIGVCDGHDNKVLIKYIIIDHK